MFRTLLISRGYGYGLTSKEEPICSDGIVQIVQVQDMTYSFEGFRDQMVVDFGSMTNTIKAKYDNLQYGLTFFQDKPVPLLGAGGFNYMKGEPDKCYTMGFELTSDIATLNETISKGDFQEVHGGGDALENQFGAMMNAGLDQTVLWSTDPDVAKVIVMITDEYPHGWDLNAEAGIPVYKSYPYSNIGSEMYYAAKAWEYSYSRQYLFEADGFSDTDYTDILTNWLYDFADGCENGLDDSLIELGALMDEAEPDGKSYEKHGCIKYDELTIDQEVEWDKVEDKCGPRSLFEKFRATDGHNMWVPRREYGQDSSEISNFEFEEWPNEFVEEEDCVFYEYPSPTLVFKTLKALNIIPIVVVVQDEDEESTSAPAEFRARNIFGCSYLDAETVFTLELELLCKAEAYEKTMSIVLGDDHPWAVASVATKKISVIGNIIVDELGDVVPPPCTTTTTTTVLISTPELIETEALVTEEEENRAVLAGAAAGCIALGSVGAGLMAKGLVFGSSKDGPTDEVDLQDVEAEREAISEVEENMFL